LVIADFGHRHLEVPANEYPGIVDQHVDGAAAAGFEVAYGSPSQFSREYSRLFGAPPLRDVGRLRQSAAGAAT